MSHDAETLSNRIECPLSMVKVCDGLIGDATHPPHRLNLVVGAATAHGIFIGIFLAALLCVNACEGAHYPDVFRIEGIGGSEGFSPVRAVKTHESSRRFSASFSNSLWIVRFQGTSPELDYEEIGTDGTSIFSVRSTETRSRRAEAGGTRLQNIATGAVRRGPVPNEIAHPHAGLLWLAFASHRYLETNGVDYLQPLTLAEANSDLLLYSGFKQKSVIESWSGEDLRPKSAVWFHDGTVRYWDQRDFALVAKHKQKPWHHPYEQGFTNAIFEASQFSNVGASRFPLRLDYWVYSPRPKGDSNRDLALIQHHWLQITNAQVDLVAGSFVPTPPKGSVRVADYRFATEEGNLVSFDYLQAGDWLSDKEAIEKISNPEIKRKLELLQRANLIDLTRHRGRTGGIVVFWIVAITGTMFFVWNKMKQKNN